MLKRFELISEKFVDMHCHLANIKQEEIEKRLRNAEQHGIGSWLSTALCPKELKTHLNQREERISLAAGIHPYYKKFFLADDKDPQRYFDDIVTLAENNNIEAIGEIGLDNRNKDWQLQVKWFLKQLEAAKEFNLPVIIHSVKSDYEILNLIKKNFPKLRYIFHGFNGSIDFIEQSKSFNIAFSLNGNIYLKKNHQNILKKIVNQKAYFFETDAPNNNFFLKENADLFSLQKIINYFGSVLSLSKKYLLERQRVFIKDYFI